MMKLYEHLKLREMDMTLHQVWLDEEFFCATFPLWNLSGQMVGIHQYRPDRSKVVRNNPRESRYFTMNPQKAVAVWGMESWNLSNTLFITEGVFDACRLTNHGYSAIAVFSYSISKSTLRWLNILNRPKVAICDNDASGLKLKKYFNDFHVVENGDLGDSSEDYVKSLLKNYT